jgi:hypothetical protein
MYVDRYIESFTAVYLCRSIRRLIIISYLYMLRTPNSSICFVRQGHRHLHRYLNRFRCIDRFMRICVRVVCGCACVCVCVCACVCACACARVRVFVCSSCVRVPG